MLARRSLLLGAAALSIADVTAAEEIERTEARRYRHPTPGSQVETGGAVIDIHGPSDRVLKVLQQFHRYRHILPRLEQSRIIGKHQGFTDVYMRAPIMRGLIHVWGVARFTPPRRYGSRGTQIAGKMVKGNLDGWHGVWRVHPCSEYRTILHLEMFIDLQIPVPNKLVTDELEWATDKAVTAVRDMVECGHSTVKDD